MRSPRAELGLMRAKGEAYAGVIMVCGTGYGAGGQVQRGIRGRRWVRCGGDGRSIR